MKPNCVSFSTVREIIQGKIRPVKCVHCDLNGQEYWDENGNDAGPAPRTEWGDNFCSGDCEHCDGLGYVL
ncbi:MAG: hypothetical protein E6Q97_38750 [Desulfurellales bacterium]|nr:MAG: hypothetical protein E6Q97_38750 [Desulfurellales bacterium]